MPTDVATADRTHLAFLTDLSLRAYTAQPCRHLSADTYQDYIILPGHISFGADSVDTSTWTQTRQLSQENKMNITESLCGMAYEYGYMFRMYRII